MTQTAGYFQASGQTFRVRAGASAWQSSCEVSTNGLLFVPTCTESESSRPASASSRRCQTPVRGCTHYDLWAGWGYRTPYTPTKITAAQPRRARPSSAKHVPFRHIAARSEERQAAAAAATAQQLIESGRDMEGLIEEGSGAADAHATKLRGFFRAIVHAWDSGASDLAPEAAERALLKAQGVCGSPGAEACAKHCIEAVVALQNKPPLDPCPELELPSHWSPTYRRLCAALGRRELGVALATARDLHTSLKLEVQWSRPAEPIEVCAARLGALQDRIRLLAPLQCPESSVSASIPCLGCRAEISDADLLQFLQGSEAYSQTFGRFFPLSASGCPGAV